MSTSLRCLAQSVAKRSPCREVDSSALRGNCARRTHKLVVTCRSLQPHDSQRIHRFDDGTTGAGDATNRTGTCGRWFCFEVKPSPGFSFYKEATGQPIGAAIVDLPTAGRASFRLAA
jgi:hypothetical protein